LNSRVVEGLEELLNSLPPLVDAIHLLRLVGNPTLTRRTLIDVAAIHKSGNGNCSPL